jgi:DNA-binding NarL/FixJ family response regulator
LKRIGVFLVDDHSVLRQGLRLLIDAQPDMHVIGETERGYGAARLIARVGADVAVVDVSMPDAGGKSVAEEIRGAAPETKIVALTRHTERAYVQQMLTAGATGYVLKQTPVEVLVHAIRAVAAGGRYLDPAVAGKLEEVLGTRNPAAGRAALELTPREREITSMVAWGHTNKEIATALGVTVKTVETHKTNIMKKLEINSRAELVRFAIAQGWMER